MKKKKESIWKRIEDLFDRIPGTTAPSWVYVALFGVSVASVLISACLYFCREELTTGQTLALAEETKTQRYDTQNGGQAEKSASTESDKKEQTTKEKRTLDWWQSFFQNLGYGILGSLVCSLVIDVGNTIREKHKEKERINREIGILVDNIKASWKPFEDIKEQYEKSGRDLFSFNKDEDRRHYPVQLRSMLCSQLSRMSEACARMKEYLEREGEDKKRATLYKNVQELIESSAKFVLEVASVDHGQEANASDVQKDLLSLYACMGKAINGLKPANADKTKA